MKKLFTLILFMLCAVSARGQATVQLSPVSPIAQPFFSTTGIPLASGCVYTFVSGTSTPLATYTDGTGAFVNQNPVILDAGGFASIWLTNSAYRFVIYQFGSGPVGSNCGNGTLQRTIDNINPYNVLNQGQNIFLDCSTSDPSGTAGELTCRSDLGKARYFSTFWDSLVTETDTATITNKTFVSPTITNGGTWTGISASAEPTIQNPNIAGVQNQGGCGALVMNAGMEQQLITCGGALPMAISFPQATAAGFGSGTVYHLKNNGTANITVSASVSVFDNGGTSFILSPGQGVDIYSDGANYWTQKGAGSIVIVTGDLTSQTANVPQTTLTTPVVNGLYRFSGDIKLTQQATTSSTLPSIEVRFTDGDSNVAGNIAITVTVTGNNSGEFGGCPSAQGACPGFMFFAKAGVPIKWDTISYASVGATPMAYAVHVRLEGPF